jgi:hypothetical protein
VAPTDQVASITDSSPLVPISKLADGDRADVACHPLGQTGTDDPWGATRRSEQVVTAIDMLLESKRRRMIETTVSATPCAMQAANVRS